MSNETVELSFSKFSIGNIDIVFAVLYFFLSLIGIAGNALVISVVRRTRSMHTTTNFLLVNLAVADILTLVTCPRNGYSLALIAHHPSGLPGDYICKFLTGNALVGITVSVSSVTLTVLAVERYRALMKPMQRKFAVTMENVLYVMTGIWGLSILVNIPDFIKNEYSERYVKCVCPFSLELVKSETVHVVCTVVFLGLIPFVVLAYCYVQIISGLFFTKKICSETTNSGDLESKKRLARLLITVTVAFYFCYIPYGSFFIYLLLQDRNTIITDYNLHYVLLKVFEFLLVCNSCFNPILYAFQSSNYRRGFKNSFCCKGNRQSLPEGMSTIVRN